MKKVIRSISFVKAQEIVKKCLLLSTSAEIDEYVAEQLVGVIQKLEE